VNVFEKWDLEAKTAVGASLKTRTGAELANEILVGKPGTAKSTLLRKMIKADIDAGDTFVWVGDPSGALVEDGMADNKQHESRFEYLDLREPDRVFGMRLLDAGKAETLGRAMSELEEGIGRLLDFLGCGTGRDLDIPTMPYMHWGLYTAVSLVKRFPGGADERLIPYAMLPDSAVQDMLMEWHPDAKRVAEIREVNRLPSQRLAWYGPGQRLVGQTLAQPIMDAMLSVPKAPLDEEWIPQHKVLWVRGGINVPRNVQRVAMSWCRSAIVQAAFARYDATGEPVKVALYCEEADEQGVGALDARYMSIGRKADVKYVLVYPTPPPTQTFETLKKVIQRLRAFQQGSAQATRAMAEEALAFQFDSQKVKDVQRVQRAINLGFTRKEIKTISVQKGKDGKTRGETEQTHFLTDPDIQIVTDERKVFATGADQLGDLMKEIRELGVGEHLSIGQSGVSRIYTPEVEDKWPSKAARDAYIRDAVARVRRRPHYYTPTFEPPPFPRPPGGLAPNPRPIKSRSGRSAGTGTRTPSAPGAEPTKNGAASRRRRSGS
jgi:hypothetical protein